MELDRELREELDRLAAAGLRRVPRRVESAAGPRVTVEGRERIVLGSNNYLGLAEHPEVRAAAADAAEKWGAGATGSRLTTGTLTLHAELERELAALKGAEEAVLFSSGYLAAVGTIPALVGRGDLVLSDALNHASLIDGCRLSRAEVRVYRHGDAEHAAELLADRERFRRALLVTDGVFSMDGDLAPLPALCDLCEERGAWVMVDDAHGTGVLGKRGAGTAELLGVESRVAVQMGTLSKALGAEGGFVAGSSTLAEYLRNRARSFIFSTAPAPSTVAAALVALQVAAREPGRRARVLRGAARLAEGLRALGFDARGGETPIVPVVIGAAEEAIRVSRRLEERGVWVPAIRPPTVPPGTARLRASVTASHTEADLDAVLAAFREVVDE
ncbi:MAG: 8-amino-7-oxononanoate synthase [Armatimonadota bacterium]